MSNLISSSLSLMPPEEIFHIESHVYYHYAGLIPLRQDIIWSTVDSINITSDKKITYKVYPHQNVPLTDKYLNVTLLRISEFSCPCTSWIIGFYKSRNRSDWHPTGCFSCCWWQACGTGPSEVRDLKNGWNETILWGMPGNCLFVPVNAVWSVRKLYCLNRIVPIHSLRAIVLSHDRRSVKWSKTRVLTKGTGFIQEWMKQQKEPVWIKIHQPNQNSTFISIYHAKQNNSVIMP